MPKYANCEGIDIQIERRQCIYVLPLWVAGEIHNALMPDVQKVLPII